MSGWHDCDQQCLRIHSTFSLKFLSLVIEGRGGVSHDVSTRDDTFNLISSKPTKLVKEDDHQNAKSVQVAVYLEEGQFGDEQRKVLLDEGDGLSSKCIPMEALRRGILLEVWSLAFESSGSFIEADGSPSLSNFILDCCLLLRSVYAQLRLLPTHKLCRKFKLRLGRPPSDHEVGWEGPFTTSSPEVIDTPHGVYKYSVKYRRNCSFHYAPPPMPPTIKTSSFEKVPLGVPSSGREPPIVSTPIVHSTSWTNTPPSMMQRRTMSKSNSSSISSSLLKAPLPQPPPPQLTPNSFSSSSQISSSLQVASGQISRKSGSLSSRCSSSLREDNDLIMALHKFNSIPPPHDLEYRLRPDVVFPDIKSSLAIIRGYLADCKQRKEEQNTKTAMDTDDFDEFMFTTEI